MIQVNKNEVSFVNAGSPIFGAEWCALIISTTNFFKEHPIERDGIIYSLIKTGHEKELLDFIDLFIDGAKTVTEEIKYDKT